MAEAGILGRMTAQQALTPQVATKARIPPLPLRNGAARRCMRTPAAYARYNVK